MGKFKSLEDVINVHLAKLAASGEVGEDELDGIAQRIAIKAITMAGAAIVKANKRAAPKMIRGRRSEDAGFNRRNYRRWRKAFELLELLWIVSHNSGSQFNDAHRADAVKSKDYKFEALTSLHAKSLLVTREIICLLQGGFPDGALSRWRTLHEHATIATFILHHDGEIAHRYLASRFFASHRAGTQLAQYAERANLDPFSDQQMQDIARYCEAFVARFGDEMWNEYGWAAPALNNRKPNFSIIEKSVGLDHWRPRFRWASEHTHGPYRPTHALLGMAEATKQVLLVGQSNSGMIDPISMTATTLTLATSALLTSKPTLDRLATVQALVQLSDEAGSTAVQLERETFQLHRRRERQKKAKSTRKGRTRSSSHR